MHKPVRGILINALIDNKTFWTQIGQECTHANMEEYVKFQTSKDITGKNTGQWAKKGNYRENRIDTHNIRKGWCSVQKYRRTRTYTLAYAMWYTTSFSFACWNKVSSQAAPLPWRKDLITLLCYDILSYISQHLLAEKVTSIKAHWTLLVTKNGSMM